MKKILDNAIVALEEVRNSFSPKAATTDPEIPRLLAIARTHIETAELFLEKASNRLYG